MAFPLIAAAAAASAGISAYGKYAAHKANKPIKGRVFRQKANTGYLRKYMADLQGRSADRARTELAMRPALRMIGAQQRQGQRQLAYQSAQQGLEGSGIEAQKQLALQAGSTKAVAGMGESVLNQELARARQMQAAREGQRMKIAGQIGQREGAVSEANRLAQFNVNEKYRQQQIQHDQQSKAIAIQGLTDVVGSAATAGMKPMVAGEMAKQALEFEEQYKGGGKYFNYNKGGLVDKKYLEYENGGLVDESLGQGWQNIVTAEGERRKKQQEIDLAEHEKQVQLETEREKQFGIAEAERLTQHEEQQKLFETGEGRRDVLDYQKDTTKTLKKKGIVGEGGEEIYGTKGLKAENVEGALEYIKTDPEEYNVLKEKADVLQKYNIGEKDYERIKRSYDAGMASEDPGYGEWQQAFPTFEKYLRWNEPEEGYSDKIEDKKIKTVSGREKKKLSKKYDKKTTALLESKGGFGAVDPSFDPKSLEGSGMTEDEYAQLVKDRQLAYKFDEALETKDPGEFVAGEYKPQYTGEAPILKEITPEEMSKARGKYIAEGVRKGAFTLESLKKGMAESKTKREEMEFAKLLEDPNVDQNTLLATSYGQKNPFKAIKIIQDMKETKSDQFADYMKSVTTTNIVNATRSGDPNEISAVYDSPEYQYMLANDPDKALSIFKTGNTAMDKITRTQATNLAKADKWIDYRKDLRYTLWGMDKLLMGDQPPPPGEKGVTGGKRILQIINDPANTEGVTQTHLTEIEGILAEMRGKAEVQDIFNEKNAGEIDWKEAGVEDWDWGKFVSEAKFEKILKGLNNFVREESTQKPFAWK